MKVVILGWLATVCALLAGHEIAASQAMTASPSATSASAAFLFTYRPKPGMEARFEEAYRRHLDWHNRHGDPLPWYGWYVTTGERLGVFIDGSFGIPFAAFDARVDPAGDAADFDQTAGAFADPLSRTVYRARPELSVGTPLEAKTPSSTLAIAHVTITPGSEQMFERAMRQLRLAPSGSPVDYTWYELVVGGEQPSYLLMIRRKGWDDYDVAAAPEATLIGRLTSRDEPPEVATAIRAAVQRAWSETWSHQPDLSLVPQR